MCSNAKNVFKDMKINTLQLRRDIKRIYSWFFFLSWIGNLNFVPTLKCTYTFKKLHVESELWNKQTQTYSIFPLNIFFISFSNVFLSVPLIILEKARENFFHPFSPLKFRCIFLGKFFFIQYLYKNREREKIAEEEKKVVVFKKKERQKKQYIE